VCGDFTVAKNVVDGIVRNVINRFLTTDEWHLLVVGFADGLSFDSKGRWMRKALADPDENVENVGTEKTWYYRVPYVVGEWAKVGFALAAASLII